MDLQCQQRMPRADRGGDGEEAVGDQGHRVVGEHAEPKLRAREEKNKAEYSEKMSNQAAAVHEPEAERHNAVLRYQDMAAKHRSKGTTPAPKKILGCFL
ncbi:hypothetical protein BS78_04G326200 [Paspalum vaginatum]|nr:hypothetical protein BS78_04G326200 [Paspalum vaginatum]